MTEESGNKEHETVKLISQKHAMIRANTDKALLELMKIKHQFYCEESRTNEKAAEFCIAEQNLRSLNERFYYIKKDYDESEDEKIELVKECVAIEMKLTKLQERIENTRQLKETIVKTGVEYQDTVNNADKDISPEYKTLLHDIQSLEDIKERLDAGDPELESIANGRALHISECKIVAIHDAIAQLEMKTDTLYVEIDEKKDSMEKVQVQIQIEEKQHQARLRKYQKQLHDLDQTEAHLKSTAEYLEKQIDHKLK